MKTKLRLLLVSGGFSTVIFAIGLMGTYSLCANNDGCANTLHLFFQIFLPTLPLFVFSLVTYFLPKRVFKMWFRFAVVWIPLSIILIAFTPEYAGDFLYSYGKGVIAFYSSILFSIISIGIILFAWLGKKKNS